MNYTWRIVNATIKDTPDTQKIVIYCNWSKTGEDADGNKGQYYGSTSFDISSIDAETFIPFDQITEDVMLSWVQSKISEESEAKINQAIDDNIMHSKYPEVTVTPPWLNFTEEQQTDIV